MPRAAVADPLDAYAGLLVGSPAGERHLAYFVSSHGFGHATRAGAVMAALRAHDPALNLHVFTEAPAWLFAESVPGGVTYHRAVTDVGVVQHSALSEDLPATLRRLDDFLPFDPHLLRHWADWLRQLRCSLVVCDIAPLGLAVAQAAELPSVLIENFTWDWIYEPYIAAEPGFARHLPSLRVAFALATYHLQAEPICQPDPAATGTLPPIGRLPRQTRAATRAALGLAPHERLVLVTLGGMAGDLPLPPAGSGPADTVYVVPGGSDEPRRAGQRLLLPHHAAFFHPDLIHAGDAVVGKLGYSTVVEACQAGVPFGYVPRAGFRESPVMAAFVQSHLPSVEIPVDVFPSGGWGAHAAQLLSHRPSPPAAPNGADVAADYILGWMA